MQNEISGMEHIGGFRVEATLRASDWYSLEQRCNVIFGKSSLQDVVGQSVVDPEDPIPVRFVNSKKCQIADFTNAAGLSGWQISYQ
jgi:hypothetical protein